MKKKLLFVLIVTLMFLLTGCSDKAGEKKTFSGAGVSITLTSDFEEREQANWDYYLINENNNAFMSKRYTKHQTIQNVDLSTLTREEYMSYCMAINGWEATIYSVERPVDMFNPFCYCYYTDADQNYGYMMIVMSDDNYFYNMHLAVPYAEFQNSKQKMMEYAITIKLG